MRNILFMAIALVLVTSHKSQAQSNKEKARAMVVEAVKLIDADKLDESIALLKQAQALDGEKDWIYPYELAYAYVQKRDYDAAVKELTGSLNYKGVDDQHYQLLGNTYDMMGNPKKALATYDKGLKRFPKAGTLFLEKGNVYWMKKEYATAAQFYVDGIKADPDFPSNYYRAALLYLGSKNRYRGMIYGEIFMNLERNSQRTAEISEYLYEGYKNGLTIRDTTVSVNFGEHILTLENISDPNNFKYPFSLCYTMSMSVAVAGVKELTPEGLGLIRTRFIEHYYTMDNHTNCPNALFDYQRAIAAAGHQEAYNRWILIMGDQADFARWREANTAKWDQFLVWFEKNKLALDESSRLSID